MPGDKDYMEVSGMYLAKKGSNSITSSCFYHVYHIVLYCTDE